MRWPALTGIEIRYGFYYQGHLERLARPPYLPQLDTKFARPYRRHDILQGGAPYVFGFQIVVLTYLSHS